MTVHRFAAGPAVFRFLAELATGRERVTYARFAETLGLGAPIGLSWMLMPLLLWCENRGVPPLPIIVVRSRDRLPSGPYRPELIAAETERVFAHDWSRLPPPTPDDLAAAAFRRRIDGRG